jgi:hypothetical protein
MRSSFLALVLFGSLAAGGCGSSSLTGSTGSGGSIGANGSPGTITFVLTAPSGSFCDQLTCGGGYRHLSILTTDGTSLNWPGGTSCGTECTTCKATVCPELAIACPAPQGIEYTGGTMTWNGSFNQTSTCGAAQTACAELKFMHPGAYLARFCGIMGTVTQPDAGLPVCNNHSAEVCVESMFNFPSDGTVHLALPAPLPQSP